MAAEQKAAKMEENEPEEPSAADYLQHDGDEFCLPENPEVPPGFTILYYCWCPYGQDCSKKGKQLGAAHSEHRARQMVFDHVKGSPYHAFPPAEATLAADGARCEAWASPEDENSEEQPFFLGRCPDRVSQAPAEGSMGAGKGKGLGKFTPAQKARPFSVGGGPKRRALEAPRAPASILAHAEAAASSAVVPVDLRAQIQAQTRGAYVFVKAR
jgi:hypothetical protein